MTNNCCGSHSRTVFSLVRFHIRLIRHIRHIRPYSPPSSIQKFTTEDDSQRIGCETWCLRGRDWTLLHFWVFSKYTFCSSYFMLSNHMVSIWKNCRKLHPHQLFLPRSHYVAPILINLDNIFVFFFPYDFLFGQNSLIIFHYRLIERGWNSSLITHQLQSWKFQHSSSLIHGAYPITVSGMIPSRNWNVSHWIDALLWSQQKKKSVYRAMLANTIALTFN